MKVAEFKKLTAAAIENFGWYKKEGTGYVQVKKENVSYRYTITRIQWEKLINWAWKKLCGESWVVYTTETLVELYREDTLPMAVVNEGIQNGKITLII